MNIEEYISSGILEAYALGDLTVEQRAEVEKNLAQYPQLKIELQRIEEAQELLLMQAAVQPRAAVKENLFKKLNTAAPEAKEVVMPSNLRFWQYSAAASIVFALTASYLAFTYYHKWQHTEVSLTNLIAQNEQIANNYNTVSNLLDEIEADLRITNNPAFNRVVLNGSANAPDAMASVYWNSGTQEVYLSIQNLKALTSENQFQLWALIDGQPVDMGVFDVANGLIKMKTTARADAFAVTIEARGGSPVPSLQTLQVIGNTKG